MAKKEEDGKLNFSDLLVHLHKLGLAEGLGLKLGQVGDVDEVKLAKVNQKFVDVEVDRLVQIHFSENVVLRLRLVLQGCTVKHVCEKISSAVHPWWTYLRGTP